MFTGAFGYIFDYFIWLFLYASILIHAYCFFRFFPGKTSPRTKLILGNLIMLACFAATAALTAETYLRFFSVNTDAFGMTLPARRWFALYNVENRWGFRDHEWTPGNPQDVYRIAVVGDSFTNGWGVEDPKQRFGDLLEDKLNKAVPGGFEVLNVAKPGWDTEPEIAAAKYVVQEFGVDEIILCYVPNDIETLIPIPDGEASPIDPPQPQVFNPDSSVLVEYLWRRVYAARLPRVQHYHDWLAAGYDSEKVSRAEKAMILHLADWCAERGVAFRVALFPFIKTGGDKYDEDKIQHGLKHFLDMAEISNVDLLPAIKGKDRNKLVVNRDDPHPNALAHRLFAERIWKVFFQDRLGP